MKAETQQQALIVLPGLTADKAKRDSMLHFFADNTPYAVYVPNIPKRRGLKRCARWLGAYLDRVVRPGRYDGIQVLAFISGGFVLRQMSSDHPIRHLQHAVYVRSPIQELTLKRVRERYGRFVLWALRGRLALDVAGTDPERLEWPVADAGQALIIETGVSQLAGSLGVGPIDVPAASWDPTRLLPGADDVLRVPESHDENYSSPPVFEAVLHFFGFGRFAPWSTAAGTG